MNLYKSARSTYLTSAVLLATCVTAQSALANSSQDELRAKCMDGDGDSCSELGISYSNQKDFEEALSLYRRSCDLDSLYGCASMGYVYLHGEGVSVDVEKAAEYYSIVCNLDPADERKNWYFSFVEYTCNEEVKSNPELVASMASQGSKSDKINASALEFAIHQRLAAASIASDVFVGSVTGVLDQINCNSTSCNYMGVADYRWVVREIHNCSYVGETNAECDFELGVDFQTNPSLNSNPLSEFFPTASALASRRAEASLSRASEGWAVVGGIRLE